MVQKDLLQVRPFHRCELKRAYRGDEVLILSTRYN